MVEFTLTYFWTDPQGFLGETHSFIDRHKWLCTLTLGLAIVIYAIGNLAGRMVSWIGQSCGTTKKVEHVVQSVLTQRKVSSAQDVSKLPSGQQLGEFHSVPTPEVPKSVFVQLPVVAPLAEAAPPPVVVPPPVAATPAGAALSTEQELDPFLLVPVGPNSLLVDGRRMKASSLASHLIYSNSDFLFQIQGTANRINIWHNEKEYIEILHRVYRGLMAEERGISEGTKEGRALKKEIVRFKAEIKDRIDSFELVKTLIHDFERDHPDCSFVHFVELVRMDLIRRHQTRDFKTLAGLLPEKIRKVLFPVIIPKGNSTQECDVVVLSRTTQEQIERLIKLGFSSKRRNTEDGALQFYVTDRIEWFRRKFPGPLAPSLPTRESHWTEHALVSVEVIHRLGTRDCNLSTRQILRYISLGEKEDVFDAFSIALMERYLKNKTVFLHVPSLNALLVEDATLEIKKESLKKLLRDLIPSAPLTVADLKNWEKGGHVRYLFREIVFKGSGLDYQPLYEAIQKAEHRLSSFFDDEKLINSLSDSDREVLRQFQLAVLSKLIASWTNIPDFSFATLYEGGPSYPSYHGSREGCQVVRRKSDNRLGVAISLTD